MQHVLVQFSDAEALQRYENACKAAQETDVLPFRLQYADMSAFLKAQSDWHTGTNLPEGVVSSSLYVIKQNAEIVATLVLRHELNAYLRKYIGHIGYRVHPAYRRRGICYRDAEAGSCACKTGIWTACGYGQLPR